MKVSLRPTTEKTLPLTLAWRNQSAVYEGAYTQEASLTWEEHYTWWKTRGPWWRFWIIQVTDETGTRDVGVVNFGQLEHWNPELAYYVGEVSLWGKGVAEEALKLALEWLRERGYCRTHTTVKEDNSRSTGLLTKMGFRRTIPARKGEWYWELDLAKEDMATEYTSGRKSLD